jgi:molybdopterin/thiamine biosynthesis adenylyltransferase
MCATQIDAARGGFTELHPVVIGEQHPPEPIPDEYADDIDAERYDRSIRAHGTATQRRVSQMHVVIAGVGGVGSAAAEQLARLGVSKITIVDPDVVEASNLPRLIGAAPHHEGKPKVDAVREAVYRANPDTDVNVVQGYLEEHEDVATTADLILQCVDRDVSRSSLAQLAVKHLIPVIDAGIRIIRGNDEEPGTRAVFVFTTIPGDTACFTCLDRGDPEQMRLEAMSSDEIEVRKEQGYLDEDDVAPKASLVTATMMAASMACSAFMEYVATGEMTDMYRYDMVTGDGMQVNAPVADDCRVCNGGLLARGDHEGLC